MQNANHSPTHSKTGQSKMENKSITRLLIANRGEIACRIMKTAQKLGIHCIAVYSDADQQALHVKLADEAFYIGPSPAKDSYLVAKKLLEIAKVSQADAIHPGYGFLSENAAFADAIEEAGLIWIGPPSDAIRAMGSKSESKSLMEKAGVPLVPGYHGDNQDESHLIAETKKIGFPALIKASAGGGGKGMRVVENEQEIAPAIAASKREGLNSFGDEKLLVEKYITRPRHVEIQVFLDQEGNGVYLFERDCSIQRRHQKVIEEAPAPLFLDSDRKAMGEAAILAAKSIHYVGAGTVEFLFDQGDFYFMEMNTRLQVEHPVTEMITGQDLVEWQLKVAQGEPLPIDQESLAINGHAMEVRVYAEDTDNQFLPTTGVLDFIQLPHIDEHVRLDTGVVEGDQISPYYDPMISKLIVWGKDRSQCLKTLQEALGQYQIVGVKTNLSFLRRLTKIHQFGEGDVSTRFIEEHAERLQTSTSIKKHHILAATAYHLITRAPVHSATDDQRSPWHALQSFQLNQSSSERLRFQLSNNERCTLLVEHIAHDHWNLSIEQTDLNVEPDIQPATVRAHLQCNGAHQELMYEIEGRWSKANVVAHGSKLWVYDDLGESELQHYELIIDTDDGQSGNLVAPMNGTLIQVNVKSGEDVKAGDALMIMEAMKMEHVIKAPYDGQVKGLSFKVGDLVSGGDILIEIEPLIEPAIS